MTENAVFTMVIVLSLVWGGFISLLGYAMRRESRKRSTTGSPAEGSRSREKQS